ncbi:MAG: Kae1-associated serine/threonine protein kinase [Candidatus Aenigmarchaeota archaeon]|nr:Kae1-associated serine/threonine protein kinase [Candidatus Aenigmarchaeota archaeon]
MKLIAQGAEAKVYLTDENKILKERVKKSYRITELDSFLRKTRTKKEAKIISDAKRLGLNAPVIFDTTDFTIEMELIEGKKLKDILTNDNSGKFCRKIGLAVSKMHDGSLVHGDLTTSNILVKEEEIYFIDFGLSIETKSLEQKAADLLTLFQNFQSVHPDVECWKHFLEGYRNQEKVLQTFEKMLKRRRYIQID